MRTPSLLPWLLLSVASPAWAWPLPSAAQPGSADAAPSPADDPPPAGEAPARPGQGAAEPTDLAPEPSAASGAEDEPALPAGLDPSEEEEPGLPAGLGPGDGAAPSSAAAAGATSPPLQWRAIVDLRAGARLQEDPLERRTSMAEARVQLDLSKAWRPWSAVAQLTVDAVGDALADGRKPELETGDGVVDLRTATLTVSPTRWLDLRIGRQTLTWGTGDLVFLNDLFPKDWTSFLIGRHDEYLKAPSDAVKLAAYSDAAGLDVVLTPRFDPDRLPLRDRISSWDPLQGRLAGQDDPLSLALPNRWLHDGEVAARLFRNVGSWELAGYGYRGFWKSPAAMDPMSGAAGFPELSVYGASVRGPAAGGLAHLELAFYDSRQDRDGKDPLTRNSEVRFLVGHERQLTQNLSLSAQYYVEAMLHHGSYLGSLPPGVPAADQVRQVLTTRLTYLALRQRLMLSAFVFASPSDRDAFARANLTYALDDRWTLLAGGNLLAGRDDHTLYGQFERNSNAYLGLRYAY